MLLQLVSLYLTADSLRQPLSEYYDSGVLVRSGVALYVILDLLFECIGRFCSLNENNTRLYHLTSYLVGLCGYAALKNVGKLHDNAFDLKGTDAVSGRFEAVLSEIETISQNSGIKAEYMEIMLKSLGICYLTQFSSDICTDFGQTSLASKIELCGKLTLSALSIPLLISIVETINKMM